MKSLHTEACLTDDVNDCARCQWLRAEFRKRESLGWSDRRILAWAAWTGFRQGFVDGIQDIANDWRWWAVMVAFGVAIAVMQIWRAL